ncbi:uncharacterized protein K452DRAFT_293016 [Aplosporella prunicola CBS 121167]|uniref:Uncharacterized protein n=1 Tax=Aplosporella prunicola CBS 121167 TaxID=1176127 RepID=A0A6A6AVE1_9PEZI|nr:uncharacterized protein K452DRAFT_293140 [Aplosporella prunicola CBS 121167]XP_033391414.1 uncharacterized protein K452DRAFT_293016 [Aplosporella prunicola CBS 121167]KAF2135556.1 hypothetical protein K452DRAFT_293140 [Aplosporella prunicola CBS 121167]KAF2135696.1 hypothetical protein K452DRAFT_293016 [Aplosporella prunicola CBS 121167]
MSMSITTHRHARIMPAARCPLPAVPAVPAVPARTSTQASTSTMPPSRPTSPTWMARTSARTRPVATRHSDGLIF